MKPLLRTLTFCGALLALATAALAQEAKDLYLDKCATCHGPDGMAKTAKGRKLKMKGISETGKMSEADMIKAVTDGKGTDMDSYAKQLSKDQIKAVVDFYRSLGK